MKNNRFIATLKILYHASKPLFFIRIILLILLSTTPALVLWLYKIMTEKVVAIDNNFLLVFCVYVFTIIFSKLIKSLNIILTEKHNLLIQKSIDTKILKSLKNIKLEVFDNSDLYNEIELIRIASNSLNDFLFNVSNLIINIISCISFFMVLISWKWNIVGLVLLSSLCEPIIYIILEAKYFKTNEEIIKLNKRNQVRDRVLNVEIDQIMLLKSYNKYNDYQNEYLDGLRLIQKKREQVALKKKIWTMAFQIISILLFSCALLIAINSYNGNQLIVFINLLLLIIPSFRSGFKNISSTISLGVLKVKYFDKLINFIKNDDTQTPKQLIDKNISFDGVEFKYSYVHKNNFQLIIDNISINTNKKYIVVGKNGCGKSTFTKLLCGLLTTYHGKILIDGNIKQFELEFPNNNFSFYLQDYNRYYETIEYNIGLGKEVSVDDLDKIFFNREYIEQLKKYELGLKTPISKTFDSKGIWPSGGEWSQILFARCVFRDRKFYIFDEPQTPLDPYKEKEFYDKLFSIDQGLVFVSHTYSYISQFDFVIFIDSNYKIYLNTHDYLYNNNQEYMELYDNEKI